MGFLNSILQVIRIAIRTLRKNRGFGFSAIAVLAIGIGATTVTFSVVYSLMLESFIYIFRGARTDARDWSAQLAAAGTACVSGGPGAGAAAGIKNDNVCRIREFFHPTLFSEKAALTIRKRRAFSGRWSPVQLLGVG